jgi:Ni/Fe-hydrogenase subunit HybB-like protein
MNRTWQRCVPVFDTPILTRSFLAFCVLGAIACALAFYREVAGLGSSSGMNDAYAWGIWKTFNIMVLTGLGSGSFSIGVAAWLFHRHRLHAVMRTAALTSFLTYSSGLVLLGVDVGRPWNFLWILLPWRWNVHSPMLEIAFCMPLYTALPLLVENVPVGLEWVRDRWPELGLLTERAESIIKTIYPWVLGFAFLLPALHQSSLGALMLLAGNQVHPLWQTPWLPLLYAWAAAFMGIAFVSIVLLICYLVWNRPIDMEVLAEMGRITVWLLLTWLAFRFADIAIRGSVSLAFKADAPAFLFWVEMLLLVAAATTLFMANKRGSARLVFQGNLLAALGGIFYRFDPTTLVFRPGNAVFYFPTTIELLIAVGFVSLAIAGFCVLVKSLAVLPAPIRLWREMESSKPNESFSCPDQVDYAGFAAAD